MIREKSHKYIGSASMRLALWWQRYVVVWPESSSFVCTSGSREDNWLKPYPPWFDHGFYSRRRDNKPILFAAWEPPPFSCFQDMAEDLLLCKPVGVSFLFNLHFSSHKLAIKNLSRLILFLCCCLFQPWETFVADVVFNPAGVGLRSLGVNTCGDKLFSKKTVTLIDFLGCFLS